MVEESGSYLSYVNQRSTIATSIVAPICYAHFAAQQMGQFLKFEEFSETSSAHMTSAGSIPVEDLPRLNQKVVGSMFLFIIVESNSNHRTS